MDISEYIQQAHIFSWIISYSSMLFSSIFSVSVRLVSGYAPVFVTVVIGREPVACVNTTGELHKRDDDGVS